MSYGINSKRGKKYAVVYTYTDSADVKRQKWETYGTKKEAAARKAQVENEMNNGTFIPPSSVTVRDFLADFVELYGSKRWGLSAYSGNTGIINNYINPVIGDMNVQDVTRRTVDSFIAQLQKMKPVSTTYRNARSEFLPPNTIEKCARCCTALSARPSDGIWFRRIRLTMFFFPRKRKILALSGRLTLSDRLWITALRGNCMLQSTFRSPVHCAWARSQG